ncbi:hypothetical protein M404DRAFT_157058 [Pisolithus tinctorius Marx 270]|uniref:Helitron helicase-like domain-containing protein n=1 Tax=Pisolithus tinctorius Marx 270 TaxID=870435 RepID=A0A0C3NCD5_PISTI|nr:hypothetical protein M404DRAFT_157058 [Pisolithus tinctorius Marx 270]
MIWGTCLFLGGPTIWMTINPADVHDPIAQVLAGEAIDLDKFDVLGGPDSHQHVINIASNPYAAAKFFNLLIESTLECLLGIKSEMGILGELSGYFSVVEAQGRGTLHMHMLLWLAGNCHSHASTLARLGLALTQFSLGLANPISPVGLAW